jgi:hypothetical protein
MIQSWQRGNNDPGHDKKGNNDPGHDIQCEERNNGITAKHDTSSLLPFLPPPNTTVYSGFHFLQYLFMTKNHWQNYSAKPDLKTKLELLQYYGTYLLNAQQTVLFEPHRKTFLGPEKLFPII